MVRLVMSYKSGGIWRETVVAKYCLEWQRKISKSCQDIWYRTGHLSSVSLRAYLAVQPYSVPADTINRQSEHKVTYQNVAWNVNSSSGPWSRNKRNAIGVSSRSVAISDLSAGHNILFQVQFVIQSLLVSGLFFGAYDHILIPSLKTDVLVDTKNSPMTERLVPEHWHFHFLF
jgi:hypothetical protein